MTSGKKKGSASAPTLPSHGSNNPAKGNAVNEKKDTIAPARPAMPDFQQVFKDLMTPIDTCRRRARSAEFFYSKIEDRKPDENGDRRIDDEEAEILWSLLRDVTMAAEALEEFWVLINDKANRAEDNGFIFGLRAHAR